MLRERADDKYIFPDFRNKIVFLHESCSGTSREKMRNSHASKRNQNYLFCIPKIIIPALTLGVIPPTVRRSVLLLPLRNSIRDSTAGCRCLLTRPRDLTRNDPFRSSWWVEGRRKSSPFFNSSQAIFSPSIVSSEKNLAYDTYFKSSFFLSDDFIRFLNWRKRFVDLFDAFNMLNEKNGYTFLFFCVTWRCGSF